jgi:formylglycine-generating enzyme required for sulfatase activity
MYRQEHQALTKAILDPTAVNGGRSAIKAYRRRIMVAGAFALIALLAGAFVFYRQQESGVRSPTAEADTSAVRVTKPQPKIWLNPIDGQKYVWIAPGSFSMGCSSGDSECSDDEKPAHRVGIEKGFWLAQTEATIGAIRSSRASTGKSFRLGTQLFP